MLQHFVPSNLNCQLMKWFNFCTIYFLFGQRSWVFQRILRRVSIIDLTDEGSKIICSFKHFINNLFGFMAKTFHHSYKLQIFIPVIFVCLRNYIYLYDSFI